MKKITKEQACSTYDILKDAKTSKMSNEQIVALVHILRALRGEHESYREFQKEIAERLKPESFPTIEEKIRAQVPLTPEERLVFTKYDIECQKPTREELAKEVEVDFKPLNEEAIGKLIESNEYNASQIMLLYDVVGE